MQLGRVVIVGAGQGGFQLAASLRQEGWAGEVLLIGDEPGLPYQRPPLSKAYMADGRAERLQLRPASFFEESRIDYRPGRRVVGIDRAAREVVTDDDARHGYDHLVLATGARNGRPPIGGLETPSVVGLRTLRDAERLRKRLSSTRHAIVVGGGFIGLEFAAIARGAGVAVTVVEAAPRLMARAVSPEISSVFLEAHEVMGAEVRLNAPVSEVTGGDAGASGVRLKAGEAVEGDLVLIATGIVPNVELAETAGLRIENGITVDGRLLTSDPDISAFGDCAAFPGPEGKPLRLESVQAATDGARFIARRLTGSDAEYNAVPWFWSDQGNYKLQIAGLPARAARFVARPADDRRVAVFGISGDTVVSLETVNLPAQHMAARKALGLERPLDAEALEGSGWDVKRYLASLKGT